MENERNKDFAEEAEEATEEARRRAGEEGRTLEDQPETGRISERAERGEEPGTEP